MITKGNSIFAVLSFLMICVVLSLTSVAAAADKENCLMCHKYRYMGRIDDKGKKNNYHVDENTFSSSIHRNISCRDCHTYINKIPHDPVTEAVNCANVCHIKPPFAQEKFSHEKIVDVYNKSIHSIKTEDPEIQKRAKPNCKYCHLNPLYFRLSEHVVAYEETLRRCFNCHTERGVSQAYNHITHRLRRKTSRSPQEIVALCAKCHQDVALMKQLNVSPRALDAVESYNRSIHGKLVRLGSQKAADCISCHASNILHDIHKKDNRQATVFRDNIKKTCHQCHENTNSWFVQVAVHPSVKHEDNPVIHLMNIGLRFALYGSVLGLVGLMLFETFGRRRDGIKMAIRNGTTWRGKSKRRSKK